MYRQGNAGKFYDVLFKAYNGDDTEAYNMIYDDLIAKGVCSSEHQKRNGSQNKKRQGKQSGHENSDNAAEYILESYANIGYPVSWTEKYPRR